MSNTEWSQILLKKTTKFFFNRPQYGRIVGELWMMMSSDDDDEMMILIVIEVMMIVTLKSDDDDDDIVIYTAGTEKLGLSTFSIVTGIIGGIGDSLDNVLNIPLYLFLL